MLGPLDIEIRDVRRLLEERRHRRSCVKEAVNDIRRYRRKVKEVEQAAVRYDDRRLAATAEGIAAHLHRQVAAGVLDAVLAERDALRLELERGPNPEARWSRLMVAREQRPEGAVASPPDHHDDLEERHGILLGQMRIATSVRTCGREAQQALNDLAAVLEEPDLLMHALVRAQTRILAFRRELKHMHIDAIRYEERLERLLRFSDDLIEGWSREHAAGRTPIDARRIVDGAEATTDRLVTEAGAFFDGRQEHAEVLESVHPATVPS